MRQAMDRAQVRISLAQWQGLPRPERVALAQMSELPGPGEDFVVALDAALARSGGDTAKRGKKT